MPSAPTLGVWLDGVRVAELTQRARDRGAIRCRYTEDALARWPSNSPLLSCSLPVQARARDASAFCRGLLPEGEALRVLAERANVTTQDTMGLLRRYGRDVAGALVIAEAGPPPGPGRVEPVTDADLEEAVEAVSDHPLGTVDESELSLAGLQDKLLLVRSADGSWGRPLRGAPSTHILKLDDRRRPGLVAAEAACLRLARALGLTTIVPQLLRVADIDVLVVQRFDRAVVDGRVTRIHQEDLCQALGIHPQLRGGRAKDEGGDGGPPSLRHAASLLDAYAPPGRRLAQLERLLETVAFTILIGNADAHAKNVAFLLDGRNIELAPLYDTVPTVMWPKLRTRPALLVGGCIDIRAVRRAHLVAEARTWGLAEERASAVVDDLLARVEAAAGEALEGAPAGLADVVAAQREALLR